MFNMTTSGFLLIDKPSGPTSHDIIDQLRRITGIRKIGHAGTLDPFASGLLIAAVGREATREIDRFVKADKKYTAMIRLGEESDTYDRTGQVKKIEPAVPVDPSAVEAVLKRFVGAQEQTPPMYSAKKVGGKKLYELARRGLVVERKPSAIEIYDLRLIHYAWPDLIVSVHCSSGTYIRVLAHDLGRSLGCGACLYELERTAINGYNINKAKTVAEIANDWQQFLFAA